MEAAQFHYQANINGQMTELHLCQDCASALQGAAFAGQTAKLGAFSDLFSDDLFSKSLLGEAFRGNRRGMVRPGDSAARTFVPPTVPEPAETKIPLEADEVLKQRRHLNACRAEMQSAIETENYERAAELRDELYRLEQSE